ncbi:hypothetical protein [Virgibacillus pantothenticus]|uniref:hypothetical protein n=1 Tax=Virgibacillus pantothenticus TaxID=1473 RepID=UPI000985DD56|nr:hypothetical protein [Virgibacillus pantothenticus]
MNKMILVYKQDWLISRIYEVSDRIRHKITYQTDFEERCIELIGNYLSLDKNNYKNKRYIDLMINKIASDSVNNRYKKEHYEVFSEFLQDDTSEDEEINLDPPDVLANVEAEIEQKEVTAVLANGDHKKELILDCWTIGNTNGKMIARMLAHTFGGNPESHRKSINRFKSNCSKKLAYFYSEAV